MSDEIEKGDRVTWQSRRADRNGNRLRTGKVLLAKNYNGREALIHPDKGQGRRQWVELGRLRKERVA